MNKKNIQKILNGEIFQSAFFKRNRMLLLFIFGLLLIYIFSVYLALFQHNRLTNLKEQVNKSRGEYIALYCKLAKCTRKEHIIEEINKRNINLVENKSIPYLIEKE